MHKPYTAILRQEGRWWIGWIQEIPGVNCQEKTRKKLIQTLRVTLREAIELNHDNTISDTAGHSQLQIDYHS